LIDEQTKTIAAAKQAETFKGELVDLLKKATDAKKEYTRQKYLDFRDRWIAQDVAIADLIVKVVCNVPCWRCVVDCEICSLLYTIRDLELTLNGDGRLTDKVYSLRDLYYWQDRNREAKKQVFERIKNILARWEKPAQTLDKLLVDNGKLIDEIKNKTLASDPAAAIYQTFIQLVPMHLAIRPRDLTPKVGENYAKLCEYCQTTPDVDCQVDLGKPAILSDLIGPQPYIIDPDKFVDDIICCLVKGRYRAAKEELATAESLLAETDEKIKRATNELTRRRASVFADFKANVANPIDCDKNYKSKTNGGSSPCNPPQDPIQE
jgi:hypothetical protein